MAKRRKRKVMRAIKQADFEALLERMKEPWRTMMVVQHAFGLRPGEVCKLRTADVDLDAGTLITPRDGKTGERLVAFDPRGTAATALGVWMLDHSGEYVFGGDVEVQVPSYRKAIVRASEKLGLTGVKPYTLRHTYACELMDDGVPIAAISQALGHSSVMTTARYYLHPSEKAMRRINAGR